ncbi:MAG TPA: hypothetical protein DDY81_09080 [Clostridiales bacterium]|nr:hypothetical protein [Clostridiales bacterium]
MNYNVKSELRRSMDAIHFSGDDKERMVALLMSAEAPRQRRSGKKLLLLALAATLVVGALTGAAVFTRWSRSAQTAYNPPQQVKEQAEKSGLSVMLEDKQKETTPGEVLSATDQGITITAVQTIADSYGAQIIFRIDGFDLPEDRIPDIFWDSVTIDGDLHFASSFSGGFYDGLTRDKDGHLVYASNGQPVARRDDEFQSIISQWVAEDGSMEYEFRFNFLDPGESYFGKEFAVHFTGLGVQSEKKAEMGEQLVSGSWDLHWTLTGADNSESSVTITPNAEIGDSGLTLLEAEIGQKSIRAVYQSDHDWDGWKQLEPLNPALEKVCMKDGSTIFVVPTEENYKRWEEERICVVTYTIYDGILDLSKLESLAYYKGWENDADGNPTIELFDYIPIS